MTKEEMQLSLDEILSVAVITKKEIDALHELFAPAPKPAIKAKPRTTAVLDELRSTIKALKNQINPIQAATSALTTDDLVDLLYIKTVERTHEIESKGSLVTFGASERQVKALQVNEDTLYFAPGTPVAIGTQVKSTNGNTKIIIAIKQVAGRVECTAWTPSTTCQSFSKTATATGFNLKQEGTNVPCKHASDTLTTFNHKYAVGTILKLRDAFYEVLGSYQEGLLVKHSLKPYQDHQKSQQIVNRSTADASDLPRNFSMYHSARM
jgi:hypothetical protein